jgi:hypothetical protein
MTAAIACRDPQIHVDFTHLSPPTHPMRHFPTLLLAAAALIARPVYAQSVAAQTEADSYTRYELLTPGSAKFRILYDVTATTPGAMA